MIQLRKHYGIPDPIPKFVPWIGGAFIGIGFTMVVMFLCLYFSR
jgi:hypothetical protein